MGSYRRLLSDRHDVTRWRLLLLARWHWITGLVLTLLCLARVGVAGLGSDKDRRQAFYVRH
jgi:hypothetical protein